MLKARLFACLLVTCVSACKSVGPATIDTACSWVKPIYISKDDVLTDDTARQILILDEQWERVCENAFQVGFRSAHSLTKSRESRLEEMEKRAQAHPPTGCSFLTLKRS
jgi:hypothetical protein